MSTTQAHNFETMSDFVAEDIFDVINNPEKNISESFRAQEINWLLEYAEDYGYERIGNSWVLVKP